MREDVCVRAGWRQPHLTLRTRPRCSGSEAQEAQLAGSELSNCTPLPLASFLGADSELCCHQTHTWHFRCLVPHPLWHSSFGVVVVLRRCSARSTPPRPSHLLCPLPAMSLPASSLDALDGFCVLAHSSSGPQCVLLIKQVLKHPHIHVFGELLECSSIQQVAQQHALDTRC